LGPNLHGCGTQAAHKIKEQEFLASQYSLNHHAEDEQGVHIEEYVPYSSVHEHVGYYLPPVEISGTRVKQPESAYHEVLVNKGGDKDNHVDYDQVPGHRRH
jgi:hypothetical protein